MISRAMLFVSIVVVSFFTGCDTPGEGNRSYDVFSDVFASADVYESDDDSWTGDVQLDAHQLSVPQSKQEGWRIPEDPPLDLGISSLVFSSGEPQQLCKVNHDCTWDDGDPLTDVRCDLASHQCIHEPPLGCFTLRANGEVYGDPDNTEGVFPDPSVEEWEQCPSGNCFHFTYCPGLRWDYFNVLTSSGQWAADWDSCPQGSFDDTVFTGGVMPEDVGCQPICFGSSEYDPPYKKVLQWQCSAYYLPD
ncbi:MAG: hypothetical protein PHQ18_02225 [Patescibacteria group bacterium]|nr:hypothetical protein [Patescibacteria group bacterium]